MRNPGVLTLPPNCSQTLWSDCPPPSWKLASVAFRARIEQQVTKTYLELSKWFILLFIPEHSRVQDQALTPVPLAYSWSQLGQNQGHIQACSHTSVQRALNNVLLPYQMQYSSKANILNFTYLEWQVLHIFGGAAMEAELNVIQTQKALLSFSHSYILSA